MRLLLERGLKIAIALLLTALSGLSATLDFTLDTKLLAPYFPTLINFQLIDGSGLGDANNTVVIRNISTDGQILGEPSLAGGASGDLASYVTLTDSSFFNSFLQQYKPGNSLAFTIEYSTNADAGLTPDQFSFAILQRGAEIPTTALDTIGSNVFLTIDFDSEIPTARQYELDEFLYRSIYVPEASSLTTVVVACLAIITIRRKT